MHDDLKDLDDDLSVIEDHGANLFFSDDHSDNGVVFMMLTSFFYLLMLAFASASADAESDAALVLCCNCWYVSCDG